VKHSAPGNTPFPAEERKKWGHFQGIHRKKFKKQVLTGFSITVLDFVPQLMTGSCGCCAAAVESSNSM
jgi:hypothetical protein